MGLVRAYLAMSGVTFGFWVLFALFDYFGGSPNPQQSIADLKWVLIVPAMLVGLMYAMAAVVGLLGWVFQLPPSLWRKLRP